MPPARDSSSHRRQSVVPQKRASISDDKAKDEAHLHSRQSTLSDLFTTKLKSKEAIKQQEHRISLKGPHTNPQSIAATATSLPPSSSPDTMLTNFPSEKKQADVIDLTESSSPNEKATAPFSRINGSSGNRLQYQTSPGPRKIVVKNLKKSSSDAAKAHCESLRRQLEEALQAVFLELPPAKSIEELYRASETLCRQGQAKQLADDLVVKCSNYTNGPLKNQVQSKLGQPYEQVVEACCGAWSRWSRQLVQIRSIFYYLDRSYLLVTKGQVVINEIGLRQFRKNIFEDGSIPFDVLQGTCDLFNELRSGDQAESSSLLQKSISMIHEIGVYSQWLEPRLAESSAKYYSEFAEKAATTLPQYLDICLQFINDEGQRWLLYKLEGATQVELVSLRDTALIRKMKDFLVDEQAVSKLLDAKSIQHLSILYKFLKSVSLEESLQKSWTQYIQTKGRSIVEDQERKSEMVVRLLEYKGDLSKICDEAFQKDIPFLTWFRESFGKFLNERRAGNSSDTANSKVGEMIAKHMDTLLRGGIKAIPPSLRSDKHARGSEGTAAEVAADEDAELNLQLDLALDLFRYIEGKDVFEAFYKSDLSRRLLMSRSASNDAERSMLSKLRQECGSSFTHNLEQMFKDIDLARDEMASYKMIRRDRGNIEQIDLNVNVLCAAAWPSFRDVKMNIPEDIARVINQYDTHYKSKHKGRLLTWRHDLAQCAMRADFPKGTKEILFSAAQAVVMLLFNSVEGGDKLSYKYIKEAVGLPEDKLGVTLQSLACAKMRVLTKYPKGRDVNDTDSFSIDMTFADPKYRIKINQIQLKETKAENKATHEQVARDRQYETQAAIVRIMKTRKSIKHAELISEVISQTKKRGHLDVREIKTHIDKLIDKDYLERDGENGYTYLA